MFNVLIQKPYQTYLSEIAIQTTSFGLLRQIKRITPTAYNTILIINYIPIGTQTQVTVNVFAEDIVEMIYSSQAVVAGNFTPTVSTGGLPYFSVNMGQRAVDIQSVVTTLKNIRAFTRVAMKTTLSGPFYDAIPNGVIPNVQSISVLFNTLLLVTYNQQPNAFVIVSPDQVESIQYSGPYLQ